MSGPSAALASDKPTPGLVRSREADARQVRVPATHRVARIHSRPYTWAQQGCEFIGVSVRLH